MTRFPTPVPAGGTLALVAPASSMKQFDLGPCIAFLAEHGYRVKKSPNLNGSWRYLSGTDEQRAADLQWAFQDPEVDAVLCARGGYGCSRLIPHLDLDRMAASGKPFLGFSDITILHLALNRRGLVTFHAPMSGHLENGEAPLCQESFLRALRGDLSIPEGFPKGETMIAGTATGPVAGGCLSLMGDSLGTPDAFDGSGKIVLIEDVGEQGYRVDARLTHLIRSGSLSGAVGIVVGEMTGTDEKEDEPSDRVSWREIVNERLSPLGLPTIVGYPFGHIKEPATLALGATARLDANAGTLTFDGT